jgi:hypothetical protein
MRRILQFVTHANQFLLFAAILVSIVFVGYQVARELRRDYSPPEIRVISSEAAASVPIEQQVELLGFRDGVFAFGIKQSQVAAYDIEHSAAQTNSFSSAREGYGTSLVNVVFSDGDKVVKRLLDRDGMILHYKMADRSMSGEKFAYHLFWCVTKDSNGDGVLNSSDRKTLFIVSPSLSSPDLVLDDASEPTVIATDILVVRTGFGSDSRFWTIGPELGIRKEIVWKQDGEPGATDNPDDAQRLREGH